MPEEQAITSLANERVKYARSLLRGSPRERQKAGAFVIEGVRLTEDALQSGARFELTLFDQSEIARNPRFEALIGRLDPATTISVTGHVLDSISDTTSPQGILAVVKRSIPRLPRSKGYNLGHLLLVLDGVRDPGNLGATLRSAEASGIVRTVATIGCVDLYSPKVVRAAMGAHFRLELLDEVAQEAVTGKIGWEALSYLGGGRPRYLATMEGGASYDEIDWTGKTTLVIGGEARGATDESYRQKTSLVSIPMGGRAESLNAAIASSIIIFEAARQRRVATRKVTKATTE